MEQLHLGQIITTPQERDAIHIAVVPVTAAHMMAPGQRVGLDDAGMANARFDYVGVIDPFLRVNVEAGQQCWLYLEPGSITSLRHDWTHPAFPAVPIPAIDRSASEQWLRDFAARSDCPGYYELMAKASEFCDGDTG